MDERMREDPYPFQAHLGLRVVEWSQDMCRIELPVADHLMNRHANVHGGVYASALDTCMGYAGCWTGDPAQVQLCLTLSLNVQFLSRPKGVLLIGQGQRTGGGRSTFFAEGHIMDETGELVAKGTGVFKYRSGGGA
ncbi:PaaI family thioesterase [Sagittula sp. SSi028]|uniref:PaaI family thioesterase n=1 Tax=Sagittula sp. SSi028 TaxID=3400636 RepID=UPI003AF67D8D